MTGWCPHKKGDLSEIECHFDGYCKECPNYRNKNKSKKKVSKNLTVSMLIEDILSKLENQR